MNGTITKQKFYQQMINGDILRVDLDYDFNGDITLYNQWRDWYTDGIDIYYTAYYVK